MATFWERAAQSVEHMVSLYCDYLYFCYLPIFILRVGLSSDCYCKPISIGVVFSFHENVDLIQPHNEDGLF